MLLALRMVERRGIEFASYFLASNHLLFIDKPELSDSYITPPSTHGII